MRPTLCPRGLNDALPPFSLSTDWVNVVFCSSGNFRMNSHLEGPWAIAGPWSVMCASERAGQPLHTCHQWSQGHQCQAVIVFHPPCREDLSGAININLVFGVVMDLNPGQVSWKLDRGETRLSRPINCWLFGMGSGISARISSIKSFIVAMLWCRYTCYTTSY